MAGLGKVSGLRLVGDAPEPSQLLEPPQWKEPLPREVLTTRHRLHGGTRPRRSRSLNQPTTPTRFTGSSTSSGSNWLPARAWPSLLMLQLLFALLSTCCRHHADPPSRKPWEQQSEWPEPSANELTRPSARSMPTSRSSQRPPPSTKSSCPKPEPPWPRQGQSSYRPSSEPRWHRQPSQRQPQPSPTTTTTTGWKPIPLRTFWLKTRRQARPQEKLQREPISSKPESTEEQKPVVERGRQRQANKKTDEGGTDPAALAEAAAKEAATQAAAATAAAAAAASAAELAKKGRKKP